MPTDLIPHPGPALRAHIRRGGHTQRQVAERLGMREPNISLMLSGKRPLRLVFLLALQQVFGVRARVWWLKQAEHELSQGLLQMKQAEVQQIISE